MCMDVPLVQIKHIANLILIVGLLVMNQQQVVQYLLAETQAEAAYHRITNNNITNAINILTAVLQMQGLLATSLKNNTSIYIIIT